MEDFVNQSDKMATVVDDDIVIICFGDMKRIFQPVAEGDFGHDLSFIHIGKSELLDTECRSVRDPA